MSKDDKRRRNAFTLSRCGMRAISSFAMAPTIAHDRLRQVWETQDRDTQDGDIQEDQPLPTADQPGLIGRFWLKSRRRAA
ncbi:MAG: hypothetical protein ACR2QT_02105 [Woeseiaceae bacterium]